MNANKILITKTEQDGTELAHAVRKAGFKPVFEPMLTIDYVEDGWPAIAPNAPLIFTSSHGVRAFANANPRRSHPVYAVGTSTAETARFLGFSNVATAAGTAQDIAEMLTLLPKTDLISAIYVRAADVSQDLKQILAKNDLFIDEFVGYKANPVENLSLNLLKSLDNREIYAVFLFSNRGARVFAELVEQYGRAVRLKPIKALCISDSVLQSVSVLPFQRGLIARTPDRYGMMELLEGISVI